MSEVKAPKIVAELKKSEAKTTDVKKPEAERPATAAEPSSADKSAAKTDATPKSASQSSISHFSSVSTPEYRAGWNSVFGGREATKKAKSKKSKGGNFPDHFEIADEAIDKELRNILYKAFQRQARKQGIWFL